MNRNTRAGLSPRLRMAADLIRPGAVVVDVGTDHAYLPVYLVENGFCPRVIAVDSKTGPLANARATVTARGLGQKIELRLSDGLDGVEPGDADDIVIAGLGGQMTVEILSRALWLKDGAKQVVLQPMTHAEDVRRFLCGNSFTILTETACFDEGRSYICICARYEAGAAATYRAAYCYYGELPSRLDGAARDWLTKQLRRLKKKAQGMRAMGETGEQLAELDLSIDELTEVLGNRQNKSGKTV